MSFQAEGSAFSSPSARAPQCRQPVWAVALPTRLQGSALGASKALAWWRPLAVLVIVSCCCQLAQHVGRRIPQRAVARAVHEPLLGHEQHAPRRLLLQPAGACQAGDDVGDAGVVQVLRV